MKQLNREELSRIAGFIEGLSHAVSGDLSDALIESSNLIDSIIDDETEAGKDGEPC